MSAEFKFFRIVLFIALECAVLSVRAFRDPAHAFAFATLFGLAILLQWLLHDENALRQADPYRLQAKPTELERVYFAGNDIETEAEASAENETLRNALAGTQQLKIRAGMGLVFGGFLFWVIRGHVRVEMAMLFPVVAALGIVPALSLNHFILPLAAAALGVMSGAAAESHPVPMASMIARAAFALSLAVALWSYRRVEHAIRETDAAAAATATDPRRSWASAAGAAAAFLVIWVALDAIVPRFEDHPAPPRPWAAPGTPERKLLEAAARHISPSRAGTGSFANAVARRSAGAAAGAGAAGGRAGSALAGLSPAELAAAQELARAFRARAGASGAGPGAGAGSGAGNGGAVPQFPQTRREAEALLKQLADAQARGGVQDVGETQSGSGASGGGKGAAPSLASGRGAGSSAHPELTSATSDTLPPGAANAAASLAAKLPADDAELARTLAAARELLRESGTAADTPAGTNTSPVTGSASASAGSAMPDAASVSSSPSSANSAMSKNPDPRTGMSNQAASAAKGPAPGANDSAPTQTSARLPGDSPPAHYPTAGAHDPTSADNRPPGDPTSANDAPPDDPAVSDERLSDEALAKVARLGGILAKLAVLGLIFAFLHKLLLRPRSAENQVRRRRPSRRERLAIVTELSRIAEAQLSVRDEVLARYQLFLRAAALRDSPKEGWLPPTDFGARVTETFPAVGASSSVVTDVFCETAYAGRDPEPARLDAYRAACGRAIDALLR